MYGEIQLEPYRFLAFQADAEWSHYDNDFKSRNVGTMISDIRGDRLFVEYRYETNDSESVYTNLLVTLTDRLKAYTDYEQNIQDSTTDSVRGGNEIPVSVLVCGSSVY